MKKVNPSLPGASRMQMPSTGTKSTPKIKGGSGKVSKRVVNSAKGKGMPSKSPYCD
jgi:hypothetical protein